MSNKSFGTAAALAAMLAAVSLVSGAGVATAQGDPQILGTFTVSGQSNIFGAGHASPPAPSGGGGGVLPEKIDFPASIPGKSISFSGVAGTVNCQGGTPFSGPDGQTG